MNIIRISTDNDISIHEFPKGSYSEQNRKLYPRLEELVKKVGGF